MKPIQTIRFQLVSSVGYKPLPPVYECTILRKEFLDPNSAPCLILSRKKASVIEVDDYKMQPRVIRRLTNRWEMSYGFPKRKSWSQGSFFTKIHVVEILPIENIMDREILNKIAICYFKNELGSEPDTLRYTYSEDGVREYNLQATMGNRIFDIHLLPFHNRIELIERRHKGKFEDAAANAGYNSDLSKL